MLKDPFISDVLVESEPGVFENLEISKNYVFEGYQVFQLKTLLSHLMICIILTKHL